MSRLTDLINKRGKVADKVEHMRRNIADDWTEDNDKKFGELSDQYDNITKQIDAEERAEEIQNQMDGFEPIKKPEVGKSNIKNPFATNEYENAFEEMVRSKGVDVKKNELSVGTDGKGGFTVPQSWAKELDRYLGDESVMRQVSTVRTYESDENMPQSTGGGSAARIGEGGTYPTGDMDFVNKVIGAHKAGSIILTSDELLTDSLYNIQAEVGEEYGRVFGELDEDDFTNGDGTGNNPSGFLTTAENALTAAGAATITSDEIIDLQMSVREVYSKNGIFMFNKNTAKIIRKLKDSDGRYLWEPSLKAGTASLLLGSPYRLNEKMPEMTTGLKAMAFGDFKQYLIGDRMSRTLKMLNELYAADGKVGWRFTVRNDGLLKRTEAIKTITQA